MKAGPRMHLHRYGGHVMCGRSIDDVQHTDNDLTFDSDRDACKGCSRAKERDDAELFERETGDEDRAGDKAEEKRRRGPSGRWEDLDDLDGAMHEAWHAGDTTLYKDIWSAAQRGDMAALIATVEGLGYDVADVEAVEVSEVPDALRGERLVGRVRVRAGDEEAPTSPRVVSAPDAGSFHVHDRSGRRHPLDTETFGSAAEALRALGKRVARIRRRPA